MTFCSKAREELLFGVFVSKQNGSWKFHSTAKASETAIQKRDKTMKEISCLEAARLQLEVELQKKIYDGITIEIERVEFFHDGKICRISAHSTKKH
ncbi:MAG: hypothetical protein NZ853_07150 [Leptospiraceae bacterium]|nr:hypothetical protein [Leptospiraceae bacterium]